MEEQGLPPELAKPIAKKYEWLKTRYHEIDKTFIARGFASVDAQIRRDETMCGEGSYEVFIDQQTHRERIEEWRGLSNNLHRELIENHEAKGEVPPVSHAEQILSNPALSCTSKLHLLQRHFPRFFSDLLAKYRPMMQEAAQKERRDLCRLWGDHEPVHLMMDENLIPLRKEVFNSVMADAFGALGFEKRNRKRGVDTYFKPLTARYAIVVATDIPNLERVIRESWSDFDQDLTPLQLNWMTHIGSANKTDKSAWFFFRPIFASYASFFYLKFRDPQSLEVCVRAKALLYELSMAPFEDEIREHG